MTRTHCRNGHPYDAANTYQRPGGGRDCRECMRQRQAAKQARRRAARTALAVTLEAVRARPARVARVLHERPSRGEAYLRNDAELGRRW